jgi:excisionase family DNA binding protein
MSSSAIESGVNSPDVCKYHTTAYAAEYLGLSKRYLEALRLSGGGPEYSSFGKAVRYTKQSLDAWASRCSRKSTSDSGAS